MILTARHLVRMTAVSSAKGRASNWWENGIEGVLRVTRYLPEKSIILVFEDITYVMENRDKSPFFGLV